MGRKNIRAIEGAKEEGEKTGGWEGRVKKDAEKKRKGGTVWRENIKRKGSCEDEKRRGNGRERRKGMGNGSERREKISNMAKVAKEVSRGKGALSLGPLIL